MELFAALNLYYKFPYGQFHTNNPIIIEVAEKYSEHHRPW